MLRPLAAFWRKAYDDNLTGMAAMVAYNLMLSVFPLALVALFIAGRVLASEDIEASVVKDLERLFPQAAESTLLDGLRRVQESSTTVGILAIVAATWFSSSFWGALDTAFCRIYRRECRSWVRQKLFALGMLAVVLLFFVASVSIPALQGLVLGHRQDLPFGLGEARAAGEHPVALRVARGARRGPGDGGRRLRIPALPVQCQLAARRHVVPVRADRARVVLRARTDPARRRDRQRAAVRAPRRGVGFR
jgi:hypothetical protein